ncbi:MAG: hypothetical protein QXF15_00025 [Candidatus Aenigmatarchaeota archaeon]|nr:hypothetical protein [Candidatus Aenigmarchaeota archaeon]
MLSNKLKSNLIIFLISLLISFLIVFLFDIHHSFYTWPFELKFIFNNSAPYFLFTILGGIIGLIFIKIIIYAVKIENKK